jgi:hypothetical protein
MGHNRQMKPQSENDWTVHALNVHGAFLERWCASLIARQPGWRVRSAGYPVKLPPQPDIPGRESAVDIVAQTTRGDLLVTAIIECKKANPEFVNWTFFPRDQYPQVTLPMILDGLPNDKARWRVVRGLVATSCHVANDARETRSNYSAYKRGDITKTANNSVGDAAYQVALGTQATAWDVCLRAGALRKRIQTDAIWRNERQGWDRHLFIPIIVTTASLHLIRFDPAAVNCRTGEVPYDAVTFAAVPHLIYEYGLPRHLQIGETHLEHQPNDESVDIWSRLYVAVVSSEYLAQFFTSDLMRELIGSQNAGAV